MRFEREKQILVQLRVSKEATHLVRYAMFCTAFWTLDLPTYIVNEAIHAGFHAKAVLAWQKLRIPVPVQAYSAR